MIVIVLWLFLPVSWVCLQCVIVVFPHHTFIFFVLSNNSLNILKLFLCSETNGKQGCVSFKLGVPMSQIPFTKCSLL